MTFSPWFLSSDVTSSDPDFGYPIDNSLRFRGGQYLQRTNLIRANEYNSTVSYWIKKPEPVVSAIEYILEGYYNTSNRTVIFNNSAAGSAYGDADTNKIISIRNNSQIGGTPGTQPLRDPTAWYHVVWLFQCGVSTGTATCYINGVQVDTSTVTSTNNYPFYPWWNGSSLTTYTSIGRYTAGGLNLNGYLAEFHMVEDVRKPTDFGRFNSKGVWVPIEYTQGGYGENGFYLNFSNPNDIGADRSDSTNSASFTATGFELTDTTDVFYDHMDDSPTSNYITLNPASPRRDPAFEVIQDANLTGISETGTWRFTLPTTVGVTSGKWYWEARCNSQTSAMVGVISPGADLTEWPGIDDKGWAIYQPSGSINHNNVGDGSYGQSWTTGDVIGTYLDLDNGKIWWYKNGVEMSGSGDPSTGAGAAFTNIPTDGTPIFPVIGDGSSSSGAKANMSFNFGQRGGFEYTPLAGYKEINTANLPASTIPDGRDHFQAIVGIGDEVADLESNLREGTYVSDLYTATNSGSNHTNPVQDKFGGMASAAFNGSIAASSGTEGSGTRTIGDVVVFSPSTPITVNTSLRVYTRNYLGSGTFGINGADRTALPSIGDNGATTYGWADLSFTGTLTELSLRDNASSRTLLFAIEVDGEILYDKQNVGTWSPYLFTSTASGNTYSTTLGTSFGTDPTLAFDNRGYWSSSSHSADTSGAGMFLVFKPPTPITVETSLRVWTRNYLGGGHYSINRADKVDMPDIVNNGATEYGWADLNFTGELEEFGIQDQGTAAARLMAIEIDGKILVDGGILNLAKQAFPHGLYWIKDRENTSQHQLFDSIRGDDTSRQTPTGRIEPSFAPTGISSAFCWSAPDVFDDTTGDINSTGRRNVTGGFSIRKYTGNATSTQSIAHGLGQKPAFIAVLRESTGSSNSSVWHQDLSNVNGRLVFETDASRSNANACWDQAPDDTYFYVGNSNLTNKSAQDFTAYVWAEIPGYSAMGRYTGENSTDGNFIYTGFKPAFVMIKRTSGAGDWTIRDTISYPHNPVEGAIRPNFGGAEITGATYTVDILSNGFKLRNSSADGGGGGGDYVYFAFAENPFESPTTAR